MGTLKQHFYAKNAPECSRQTQIFKPAAAYEVENNITGIAKNYCYPGGLSATEFEQANTLGSQVFACYIPPRESRLEIIQTQKPSSELMDALNDTWKELTLLNPRLDKLDVDHSDPLELVNAINGVACQINPDDIGYFIKMHRKINRFDVFAQAIHHDPDLYMACVEMSKVTGNTNMNFHWLPAPSTVHKITHAIAQNLTRALNPPNLRQP